MCITISADFGVYYVTVDLTLRSTKKTLVKLLKNLQKLSNKSQLSTPI